MNCLSAVSYTHLDVYKRQVLGLTDTWYGDRIFQICDEEKNVVEVLAYRRNMKNRDTLPQEDPS